MVEIWRDGEFVGAIYGHPEGVRVMSKYLFDAVVEPLAVIVKLSDSAAKITPPFLMSQPAPEMRELRLGPRLLIVKGKPLGTCDGLSLTIAEATEQEIEELQSANEISMVKMAKG